MKQTPADEPVTITTPAGPARAHVAGDGADLLCLGHGAGGGIGAPDLVAVRDAAVAAGWTVALVEQPYRVAGRRAPDRAPRLDEAWLAAVAELTRGRRGRLVVGGRSSGARVACRTAVAGGAVAVVALAFPLRPPRRPDRSRADELIAAGVPVLVVQGDRDPFGIAADFPPGVEVASVRGDHSLRRASGDAAALVVRWLAQWVA